jgi:hypothetical protein
MAGDRAGCLWSAWRAAASVLGRHFRQRLNTVRTVIKQQLLAFSWSPLLVPHETMEQNRACRRRLLILLAVGVSALLTGRLGPHGGWPHHSGGRAQAVYDPER